MKIELLLLFMFLSAASAAQVRPSIDERSFLAQPNQLVTLRSEQPYTSAVVRLTDGQTLSGTYIVAAGDTVYLQPEPHALSSQPASALCVFSKPVTEFSVWTGTLSGTITLQQVYVPPLDAGYVQAQMQALTKGARADCEKPVVVPASIWRKGLVPPKEPPVATRVQFVIVHHSAGSNTLTDYTEEVRNIYVFHTQSNGWNDAGYNFLIGRDGVIFEGRDGQGIMDGDNVLGAHFCGQNSGTMGICLMGNFNDVEPTGASLTSLQKLIGWKLKKEGLQPVGTSVHAGSGKQLNKISGHRDGSCATECPGNNLYAKLSSIRQDVSTGCSFTTLTNQLPLATEPAGAGWTVFPNPAAGTFYVQHQTAIPATVRFELFDQLGTRRAVTATATAPDRWQIGVPQAGNGLYWLRCSDEAGTRVISIWLKAD